MHKKEIQKLTDFETKKSVHINLTKQTHKMFRSKLFDHDLSMQEVFELFASLVGHEDSRALEILIEAKSNKRAKALERLNTSEVNDLYDAISQVDPFGK